MYRIARRTMLAMGLGLSTAQAQPAVDEGAIRTVLMDRFDRPDARLTVLPVIVLNDMAVAGWTQGEMGGRALLERRHSGWVILLCAGDALLEADTLHRAGLTEVQASTMADRIAMAEATVAPERRALFSRFDGIVTMDDTTRPHP